jgi:hypothetical protein
MHRIRPRTCVLSGATIGLLAGAAVYGVVSVAPPSPSALGAVSTARALPRARAADCAPGQSLQHGVCIIHIVRTVVAAAPGRPRHG